MLRKAKQIAKPTWFLLQLAASAAVIMALAYAEVSCAAAVSQQSFPAAADWQYTGSHDFVITSNLRSAMILSGLLRCYYRATQRDTAEFFNSTSA